MESTLTENVKEDQKSWVEEDTKQNEIKKTSVISSSLNPIQLRTLGFSIIQILMGLFIMIALLSVTDFPVQNFYWITLCCIASGVIIIAGFVQISLAF